MIVARWEHVAVKRRGSYRRILVRYPIRIVVTPSQPPEGVR